MFQASYTSSELLFTLLQYINNLFIYERLNEICILYNFYKMFILECVSGFTFILQYFIALLHTWIKKHIY
jgi:hypothetical protein